MSETTYRKTPLPVKLNLADRNTRQQLTSPNPADTRRGELHMVNRSEPALQSEKDCEDVMVQHLRDWLRGHGIDGVPESNEVEQTSMWKWIREFHEEYDDDWFARNMPRVLQKFRPIFNAEMKRRRKAATAAPKPVAPAANLLDFDTSPPAAAVPPAAQVEDLLCLGSTDPEIIEAKAADVAVAPAASAAAAVGVAGNGSLGLQDLSDGDGVLDLVSVWPSAAPVVSSVSPPLKDCVKPLGGLEDIFSLVGDGGLAPTTAADSPQQAEANGDLFGLSFL